MPVQHGGRLTLRLQAAPTHQTPADNVVRYEAEFELPEGKCVTSAEVSIDSGSVAWGDPGACAMVPEWLRDYATATLRAAFRNRHNVGWPRRLTRWRKEPAPRS